MLAVLPKPNDLNPRCSEIRRRPSDTRFWGRPKVAALSEWLPTAVNHRPRLVTNSIPNFRSNHQTGSHNRRCPTVMFVMMTIMMVMTVMMVLLPYGRTATEANRTTCCLCHHLNINTPFFGCSFPDEQKVTAARTAWTERELCLLPHGRESSRRTRKASCIEVGRLARGSQITELMARSVDGWLAGWLAGLVAG